MLYNLVTSSLLLAFYLFPLDCRAQAIEAPEEIIITGKVSGPPLWQVRNGDNTLWLFGVMSPLPPGLELDTARLDSVLAETDEVLGLPDFDFNESFGPIKLMRLYGQFRKMRVNEDGKTLEQVLPSDLYQRLLAAKTAHGPRSDKLLKMRPLMAAEMLEGAALKSVGLDEDTDDITKQLRSVMRKHDVKYTEVVYTTDMSVSSMMAAMSEVPFDSEVSCLSSMLDSLEGDLDLLKDKAEAWAYGQVGELYATSARSAAKSSCFQAMTTPPELQNVMKQAGALWLTHVERALGENRNTFAMLDMQRLLATDGVLETLRERGYEVIEPL